MEKVSLRVRELAENQGLNISKLQIKSGLAMTTVRRYWYEEGEQVSLVALAALAKALGVNPGELLGESKDD